MKRRKNWLTALAVLAASFAGGSVSHWLLRPRGAGAQPAKAAPAPKTLRANEFVITDASGKAVAVLSGSPHGKAGLAVVDSERNPTAVFSALPKGQPIVAALDAKGNARALLGEVVQTRHVVVTDARRKRLAYLGVSEQTGGGVLELRDRGGKPRTSMGLIGEGGTAGLLINTSKAQPAVQVLVQPNGSRFLVLLDEKMHPRVHLSASAKALTALRLTAGEGKAEAILMATPGGAVAQLKSKTGKPAWQAP